MSQGSVLGPTIFSMYVNDSFNYVLLVFFVMYADDTSILTTSEYSEELQQNTHMAVWFTSNNLKENKQKTQILIIAPRLSIGCSVKLVESKLDDGLSWFAMKETFNKKLSKTIFNFR